MRTPTTGAALTTFALLLGGWGQLCLAGTPSQTTFTSPEEAGSSLFAAVQSHDEEALTRILGAGTELVSSDDEAQDALEREAFLQKFKEMHRFVRYPGGVAVLYIGAENWPFPVPIESSNGAWRFDSAGGAEEMRFRRIGENEVTAIGICHALVAAETRPGTDTEADDLVKMAFPGVQSAHQPLAFHGYYYRILYHTGGKFAAIAYPALYRSSGVMTFIVNGYDRVYEKDLGPDSVRAAEAMQRYHLDSSWSRAEPFVTQMSK